MLNLLASLAMSTSVLKALPGKLDIKRLSPSMLDVACCDSPLDTTACRWLRNADIHGYANCDKNIPCGSRAMNNFTNC